MIIYLMTHDFACKKQNKPTHQKKKKEGKNQNKDLSIE